MKKYQRTLFLSIACLCMFCLNISALALPPSTITNDSVYLKILGIAQDGGYPQLGCTKSCCMAIKNGEATKKNVVSLGLVSKNRYWLFEATPDISHQLDLMQIPQKVKSFQPPNGIFLTHAHIGHYTGLQFFGREAFGASNIPVYAMPRMFNFLNNNGPWSQLVQLKNIELRPMQQQVPIKLEPGLQVMPILVPHRDEYSETIGLMIQSRIKKVLFIPDIDKWDKWQEEIVEMVKLVDLALIDGTFFKNGELANRDMSEVPHPFVEESLQKFSGLSKKEKAKICFIHFNHTNPLIRNRSTEKTALRNMGFGIAEEGMIISL